MTGKMGKRLNILQSILPNGSKSLPSLPKQLM